MKYLLVLTAFFFTSNAKAHEIIVKDVKVSVTADSAATAREQALEQAHGLAFKKLLTENFPEKSGPPPSHDAILNMVTGFSIDREKTTPKSYTASLSFEFDGPSVHAWVQNRGQPSVPKEQAFSPAAIQGKTLKIVASYATLPDWQVIKKTLENFSGIQKINILALSPQNASMEIVYGGDIEKLQQHLLHKGLLLSSQGDTWVISSNALSLQ